jgi:sulfatase maturation enzyme AslB (radical SAM superfamily)
MRILEITTNVNCPMRCDYCPQNKLSKAYTGVKYLELDLFCKCLDKIPKDVEIIFSGFSEPWNNKRCTEMVVKAVESRTTSVFTTLFGISIEDAKIISKLKFKNFCIHLPDDEGLMNSVNITDEYIEVLKICTKIDNLTYSLFGRINKNILTIFDCSEILKYVALESTEKYKMFSRAGLLENYGLQSNKSGKIKCLSMENENHFPNHNVLLPDGKVVLCCMDFGIRHVLGNLFEQNYEEMFMSNEIEAGLRGEIKILCHYCEYGVCF